MPPPIKISRRFSFFGFNSTPSFAAAGSSNVNPPQLKLETDRELYGPGDLITVTIEVKNTATSSSLLIEKLAFEVKGVEKLDAHWFNTPKPSPDSKQRRGEYVFMDCSIPTIVSNQIVSSGATRTYVVRFLLPSLIPPSYKGATIRYLYYVRSSLSGQYLVLENGTSLGESRQEFSEQEARVPLKIWVTQKINGLLSEGNQTEGIVPVTTVLLDAYWKELGADTEWAKLNEPTDGVEEDYDSSRDEMLSVASYNPAKGDLNRTLSSLSLNSSTARSSNRGSFYGEGHTSIVSNVALPRLSVAEVIHDSAIDRSPALLSPSQQPRHLKAFSADDDSAVPSPTPIESGTSEGFVRGRSYNIRLDDQVMLRFSPKNLESTYYFCDMIGGTLTFFHEEGARRCLELSIMLEMTETINRNFAHHSRRHIPTVTKVYSDHHEVVADLVQTSFLFSIPVDGPMSFSTHYVSVQWALRFEFLTTPRNVNLTRFEHPLLIEGRDKCVWILPITIHAPPSRTAAMVAQSRNERPVTLEPLWVRT